MNHLKKQLKLAMRGGRVRRYHTVDTIAPQSVAEHSYGVAWLVYLLSGETPSVALLMAALSHDIAECVTGDIPAPAKRSLGIGRQFDEYEERVRDAAGVPSWTGALTAEELRILKFADTTELVLHCLHEISMGNRGMRKVLRRGLSYLRETPIEAPRTPEMERMLAYVVRQSEKLLKEKI